jgi:hypothetical protein
MLGEGVQVGINRVGMYFQGVSNLDGYHAGCVEDNRFDPSALPRIQMGFEPCIELAHLGCRRLPNRQRTAHR